MLRRLEVYIENVSALSNLQFKFKGGRSTTDAIAEVIKTARCANSGPVQYTYQCRYQCAVVTIDVKNAFNSVPRRLINKALRHTDAPLYIIKMIRSYLCERAIMIDGEGSSYLPVT